MVFYLWSGCILHLIPTLVTFTRGCQRTRTTRPPRPRDAEQTAEPCSLRLLEDFLRVADVGRRIVNLARSRIALIILHFLNFKMPK